MTADSSNGTPQTGGEATAVMLVFQEVLRDPAFASALVPLLAMNKRDASATRSFTDGNE
jgi:hypothetical protein